MKQFITALLIGVFAGSVAMGASKLDVSTGGDDAEVVFGPGVNRVTAIAATSDVAGQTLKGYVRNAKVYRPNAAITNTALIITLDNGVHEITTNDLVVVEYPDKSVAKFTVSASQTNSITLDAALTAALTTDSRVWELEQVWQQTIGTTTVTPEGNPIVDVPSGSPVFWSLSANTTAVLSVTAQ